MKTLQERTKIFSISVFTIAVLLFNSALLVAQGNVLYEKNYSVNSNESLVVKMSGADIDITGSGNDEVHIIIEGNESIKDKFDFNFSYNNGTVEVTSEKKSNWTSWSFSKGFKIKIKVPSEFNLEAKTSGGDVEVKNVDGEMGLYTSGGDVEIDNSNGTLVAKTSGGDIEINGFVGSSVLKTSGGDIEVKKVTGDVKAATSGGDVELAVSDGKVDAGTSGGDISLKYSGANKGVVLHTSGGSISIKLPSDFSADVKLKTSGGSIKNNFSSKKLTNQTKSKFEGKYNDGGAELSARTSGGSIYVSEK